jgi:dihydroflavonol-4-reductase
MRVLVTGANGHLGTNLVRELLATGHAVRGSVRALADPARTAHLTALGPVELVEADLDKPASLRAAMDGIDAVFHTAAVYTLFAPGQDAAIVRASVEGIDAAMKAAKDAGVRRIVVTSSSATLPLRKPGEPPATEADWTSDLRVPYLRAKTEGERRAWALAGELGLDLATVLPGAFGGPGFERNTPTIDFIEAIMKGALQLGAPPINYPWVDVRDVVRAHLLVLEKGRRERYIAVNDRQPSVTEIAQIMHAIDPKVPRPLVTLPSFLMPVLPWLEGLASRMNGTPRSMTDELAGTLKGRLWSISNAKIRSELGWEPSYSIRQSLADTMAAITTRASGAQRG